MISLFINTKKFIPNDYKQSIYDIDFNKLYASGKRLILTDLDNTLIPYDKTLPDEALFNWKKEMEEIGFEIIIVSNSGTKRVKNFSENYGVKWNSSSKKPLLFGIKKALKKANKKYSKDQVVFLGDQLMTDVLACRRYKIYVVLVKAIKRKSEIAVTRMNRRIENIVLRKIKRKKPEEYNKLLKTYGK